MVLYQLKQNNLTSVHDLREAVAVYLEEHNDMYMPFVISPIASENVLNSDTEIPNAVDASISSVADPDTRSALVYAGYVDRVRNGSWGDHVVIAAIANMFHVTINVVHARQSGCTVSVTSPVNDESDCEINLGLIMQYYFIGLDKQVMPISQVDNVNVVNHSIPNNPSSSPNMSNNYVRSSDPIPMSHSEQGCECDNINDLPTPNTNSDVQPFEDSAM